MGLSIRTTGIACVRIKINMANLSDTFGRLSRLDRRGASA
jgi:hypothetical protein